MDESVVRRIQKEGAEALLNAGVSVPLKEFRLPFKKKPVRLRVTMKRPYMSGQLRIARTYLSMGVTSNQMDTFTKEEEMRFIVEHSKAISRIIAYTICQGYVSRHLFVCFVAWFIRNFVEDRYMQVAFRTFIRLMGTKSFTSIIRSVEMSNPMKLRLSQKRKGS